MKRFKERIKCAALPLSTAIMMAPVTMSSLAAEGDAAGIDLATITNDAMSQIKGDMTLVIAASAGAAIGLISITVGIAYLQKKAKGLKSVG